MGPLRIRLHTHHSPASRQWNLVGSGFRPWPDAIHCRTGEIWESSCMPSDSLGSRSLCDVLLSKRCISEVSEEQHHPHPKFCITYKAEFAVRGLCLLCLQHLGQCRTSSPVSSIFLAPARLRGDGNMRLVSSPNCLPWVHCKYTTPLSLQHDAVLP